MKEAYKRGYWSHSRGDDKKSNPYSQKSQSTEFYAWLAGWNDRDMGYDLDLKVFE